MPIPIDRSRAAQLAPQLDEALDLIANEFEGLDQGRRYRNAFARLLKPDPLGRVLMLGTDQRDLFVPELRRVIETSVPGGGEGHIFDFGAGNGQTVAQVAAAIPSGTRISIEEPNPDYVADYRSLLEAQPHLRPELALTTGFDDLDAEASRSGVRLPADGGIDLVLAMHMVYFLADLPAGLRRMARFLRPGGSLFAVVADESDGYTGLVTQRFIAAGGDTGANHRHLAAIGERRRLLGSAAAGGGGVRELLAAAGMKVEHQAWLQPSRLYGHTLSDLIALATITVLSGVDGVATLEAAARLLRDEPEAAGLRIEDGGPRAGMWSVAQPQWISIVRRRD